MGTTTDMDAPDTSHYIEDVTVLLLAAGSGERLGARRPKAFVGLGGEVLLAHSLRSFEAHEAVDGIIIVAPADWIDPVEVMLDDLGCDRVAAVVPGGASRAESLRCGMEYVRPARSGAVLVHDAARPFVAESVVDRVLAPLADGVDCAVPVLEVPDTVKQVDAAGRVVTTLDRGELRLVQTPQCCRASSLAAALEGCDAAQLAAATDDAALIERWGGEVTCVQGDPLLRKVTTTADLAWAEAVLAPTRTEDSSDHHDDGSDEEE